MHRMRVQDAENAKVTQRAQKEYKIKIAILNFIFKEALNKSQNSKMTLASHRFI
jgi:hypothetical protein